MKTLRTVFALTLVMNLLLVLGFVGYLYVSGRLSEQRVRAAVAIFRPTIEEQKSAEAQEAAQVIAQEQKAKEIARLQAVSQGPMTLAQRLDREMQSNDVAMERLNRMQRAKTDLEAYFQRVQTEVRKQQTQIDAERQQFQQALEQENKLRGDQDFQQAVQMYEQLKPKQAKQLFQQLMSQGKTSQVVDYLAAMQLRKASAVLKQFKTGDEIGQATDLIQRLRQRGIRPVSSKTQLAGST